ncbi:MAG: hypothetical protein ABR549_09615 [Mycobacteriales bacterium]
MTGRVPLYGRLFEAMGAGSFADRQARGLLVIGFGFVIGWLAGSLVGNAGRGMSVGTTIGLALAVFLRLSASIWKWQQRQWG